RCVCDGEHHHIIAYLPAQGGNPDGRAPLCSLVQRGHKLTCRLDIAGQQCDRIAARYQASANTTRYVSGSDDCNVHFLMLLLLISSRFQVPSSKFQAHERTWNLELRTQLHTPSLRTARHAIFEICARVVSLPGRKVPSP